MMSIQNPIRLLVGMVACQWVLLGQGLWISDVDGRTPRELGPGSPDGAYALSGLDTIDREFSASMRDRA